MHYRRFDPFRDVMAPAIKTATRPSIPMDAIRTPEAVIVSFDLPGVDPEAVDLTIENKQLSLRFDRPASELAEGDTLLTRGRPSGSFSRELFLGDGLDGSAAQASFDNGVLTVTIPVAIAAQPHKVAISSGAATADAPAEVTA